METLESFYKRILHTDAPEILKADYGHVNVFSREVCQPQSSYIKRDFFKISLIIGDVELHYADKWIKINQPALLFSNPMVPYSMENAIGPKLGWFCIFDTNFLQGKSHVQVLTDSHFLNTNTNPIFFLNEKQVAEIQALFGKINEALQSDYQFKYDLIRTYIELLIHEALMMRPAEKYEAGNNASVRILNLFLELLERQFPVNTNKNVLLKNPNDFARQLAIHPNYLNKALKETTGKTTSDLIAERLTREAERLLKQTDMQISEISYAMGFEYPSYFNNFIKKRTQLTPLQLRQSI